MSKTFILSSLTLLLVSCASTSTKPVKDLTLASTLKPEEQEFLKAVSEGSLRHVRRLLKKGVNVNTTTGEEAGTEGTRARSALMVATLTGNLEMVQELCAQKADATYVSDLEGSALLLAIRQPHTAEDADLVGPLIRCGAPINKADRNGITPAMAAIDMNDVRALDELVRAGAELKSTPQGQPPLIVRALQSGRLDIAHYLLHHGVDANERNADGETALGVALRLDNPQLIDALKAAGARLATNDLLASAVAEANLDSVKRLLPLVRDINAPVDDQKRTVLHQLVDDGNGDETALEIMKVLLSAGADANAHDGTGQSVLAAAAREAPLPFVDLLLSSGAKLELSGGTGPGSALLQAAITGRLDTLKHLVAAEKGVKLIQAPESPLLVEAILAGQIEVAHFLIDQKANLAAVRAAQGDLQARSALMAAIEKGFSELSARLIQGGAPLNAIMPDTGLAPLTLAVKLGNEQAVRMLLDAGASWEIADNQGKNAWDYAVELKNASIDEALRAHGAHDKVVEPPVEPEKPKKRINKKHKKG